MAELTRFITTYGITDLVTWAVPPGLHPRQMRASLERFASEVAPRLKAAVSGAQAPATASQPRDR